MPSASLVVRTAGIHHGPGSSELMLKVRSLHAAAGNPLSAASPPDPFILIFAGFSAELQTVRHGRDAQVHPF